MVFGLLVCGVAVAQMATSNPAGQNDQGLSSPEQQITNGPVAEFISDSACTIGWSTRVSGKMSLRYGTERNNLTQTADAVENSDGRNHHVRISGLTPNTRYYFQVLRNGQPVGGVGTFRTVGTGEQPVRSKAIIPQ
jgi:phosphodiesterase/alkaline phosphatase D-like protein